jgi:hypothetical protein
VEFRIDLFLFEEHFVDSQLKQLQLMMMLDALKNKRENLLLEITNSMNEPER